MRLLLINPNTTQAVTERVLAVARGMAASGTELVGVTGRFGAAYIASRSAYAIAGHAALDAWADAGGGFDAVLLACFGDPGLDALRELSPVPVIGMADAAVAQAAGQGGRFGIVTGGERWDAMLREFVAARGLTDRLSGIHTVAPTGGDIARDPAAAVPLLARACRAAVAAGADRVILGGAGLAGLVPALVEAVRVPLIDGTLAAVQAAEAVAASSADASGYDAGLPPVPSIGLSAALAARISGTA
jgi:Asp/Glu/hydantoin racemase